MRFTTIVVVQSILFEKGASTVGLLGGRRHYSTRSDISHGFIET